MTSADTSRQWLIALNSGQNLARDSICRLALTLDDWVHSRESSSSLRRRLGVPEADLREARRLLLEASRLADEQLERARRDETRIFTLHDPSYPKILRQLDLPPPVLYCRGEVPTTPSVSIVGSRAASAEGLEVAELFGRQLAARGLTVTSGFARGIDLAAHRGSLSVVDGSTIAVLGCGIDVDYPRRRDHVRAEIAQRGSLVSEFPFGTRPAKQNFPIRNRIIAALSLGTLIVQAKRRSGSLITARLALDLGRDVYAVPGSIFDPRATGTNTLIRDGAMLVSHPDEIVESLPLAARSVLRPLAQPTPKASCSSAAGEVYSALEPGQIRTADSLASATDLPLQEVLARLMELEIAGLVNRLPGAAFCRKL